MYNIGRFLTAQDPVFDTVLAELKAGKKETHWIWYIFPQLASLGQSENAKFYGIKDLEEAKAYAAQPILSYRLALCAQILLIGGHPIPAIMGVTDNLKLISCATLFGSFEWQHSEKMWDLTRRLGFCERTEIEIAGSA